MPDAEAVLTYGSSSTVASDADGVALELAASLTPDGETCYFDGFLNRPEQSAQALLLLAKVARSRYYTPPNMLTAILAAADPVVTASADRLRFESFSACCGVAARYDILPAGLDRPPHRHGTSNVDLNRPVRTALANVHGLEPLHLSVGHDVTFTTSAARIVERKVPLPARWVRGFAEAQASTAQLQPRAVLTAAAMQRFVRDLPTNSNGRSVIYAVPGRDGLRLSSRASGLAVPLGGPSRLRVLEPMLRFATSVTVYGPDPKEGSSEAGISAWQVDMPDGRFVVTLSPMAMRGFSGEGGILVELADPQGELDALTVAELVCDQALIDVNVLAAQTGIAHDRIRVALTHLAAAGRVGYDAAEGAYFHRELPWNREPLAALHPRLGQALDLVDSGAVRLRDDGADLISHSTHHLIRRVGDEITCSCPWFAQHRNSRGPCKHLLAYQLASNQDRSTFDA